MGTTLGKVRLCGVLAGRLFPRSFKDQFAVAYYLVSTRTTTWSEWAGLDLTPLTQFGTHQEAGSGNGDQEKTWVVRNVAQGPTGDIIKATSKPQDC